VLRLPDGNDSRVAHRIACAAQTIAAAHTIPYVKMLGGSIVAAAGHAGSDRTATARLADAAIALREACADMFDQSDDGAAFGLGLDAGTVQTGQLGSAPGLFNIWGEAVRGAETLAGSAPAGAIQVSEAVFALLNRGFLFRPRGRFHRPGIGETNLYVLAGRA
jgi:class 3 adenylate cyclase